MTFHYIGDIPAPPVYLAFQSAYGTYRNKLGEPTQSAKPMQNSYYAVYQHATIIWNETDKLLYRLDRKNLKWTVRADEQDEDIPVWCSDACNKRRFRMPEREWKEGLRPPYGGVALLWFDDSADWEWIGWRRWHCAYSDSVIHKQDFEGGFIIGRFRRFPSDNSKSQAFVFMKDETWEADVSDLPSPPCHHPSHENDHCKVKVALIPK